MGLLGFVSPYFWFQAPPFSTGIPLSGLESPHFWIGLPHFSSESPHFWRGVAHFWRGFPHLSPESPFPGVELPSSEVGAPHFWSESPSPGVQLPISAVQLPILAAGWGVGGGRRYTFHQESDLHAQHAYPPPDPDGSRRGPAPGGDRPRGRGARPGDLAAGWPRSSRPDLRPEINLRAMSCAG